MVTVILRGGLGNQLFQYATGRALSLRTDSDLCLEISQLDQVCGSDVAKRSLRLDPFELPVEYDDGSLMDRLDREIFDRFPRAVATVSQLLAKRLFGLYVDHHSLTFDPRVVELPGDITLDGYWQSEQYFSDFSETLRREISVNDPCQGENRRWHERISDTDSVSVHVRRGDYVSLGWTLPQTYYRNAINNIRNETSATTLFFFSDDMGWVRSHCQQLLPEDGDFNVNYIECNDGETAHEDLRLMRSCNHHVIANSSFSWWGAWLDEKDAKQIVAPDYWVHDSVDRLDIVPDRWTTVDW